ncbi:S9 family peptidase [Elongatibacter sediminis]|uniref:DPP IV N-terminal domain-containing protein n=1 Tax=Elongatibacter sediminis TaxID=3119006 RepID=A0AAW9RIS9_9GAMM
MPAKIKSWSSIILLALVQQITSLQAAEGGKALTIDAIFASGEFSNDLLSDIQWIDEGAAFTFSRRNAESGLLDIHRYDVSTGESGLLVAGSQLTVDGKPVLMSAYRWSDDQVYLLIIGPVNLTWDSVREAPYYMHHRPSGTTWALADGDPTLRNVYLSPDSRKVGYVLNNDLYVTDLETRSTQAVTTDGSADIFNGIFDYSSGFFRRDAWHWSPDGKKIAFWRLDATDVNVFHIVDELPRYNIVRELKYANTGDPHAIYRIGIYDVERQTTLWMETRHEEQDYIPRVAWIDKDRLALQRLYQSHKTLELMLGDATTGETRTIVTDSDPAWIGITDDLFFFEDEDRFVWTSEKSGYRHAYLYDHQGNETQLTDGDWEISSLIALDEAESWLYFYAKKDSYIDQHVYRVGLDGSPVEKLTGEPGWYQWAFSPGHRYVIQTYSNANTPPAQTLLHSDGEPVRVVKQNRIAAMKDYVMPRTEFIRVELEDGIEIDGFLIRPTDFDPSSTYPAIGYGYGNAGSQVVVNRWGTQRGAKQDLWHRYMAEQGYVIFAFDNRTTAGRGKLAKNLTYGHYAKYAIQDFLEGVKHLKAQPYIDAGRVGFWGWSGGGYLAAALMTKGAPHIHTGVSVAPVINLDRYQAIGLQRWMGPLDENAEGYRKTNLLNYADRLQGNLLLIHGTGDENVKYAFTLQFANALIEAGKQFDMMLYPNQHHGINDYQQHVFTKIANYFEKNLKRACPCPE